jgi:hypothetical protein
MQVCELKEIIFVVLADCTPKAGSNGWHYRPRWVEVAACGLVPTGLVNVVGCMVGIDVSPPDWFMCFI